MPIEAASVHFLIGMCHSELGRPAGALDAFNNAIRVNPDYAEVTIYTYGSHDKQLVLSTPTPLVHSLPENLEFTFESNESMRIYQARDTILS